MSGLNKGLGIVIRLAAGAASPSAWGCMAVLLVVLLADLLAELLAELLDLRTKSTCIQDVGTAIRHSRAYSSEFLYCSLQAPERDWRGRMPGLEGIWKP